MLHLNKICLRTWSTMIFIHFRLGLPCSNNFSKFCSREMGYTGFEKWFISMDFRGRQDIAEVPKKLVGSLISRSLVVAELCSVVAFVYNLCSFIQQYVWFVWGDFIWEADTTSPCATFVWCYMLSNAPLDLVILEMVMEVPDVFGQFCHFLAVLMYRW